MKKYEKEIEIDATPEDVWRALTDAEELKRWFPLDARIRPGVGGALWLSWGEGSDWEAPIEVWEPSKHLRTVDTTPGKEGGPPTRVAVDYIIESRGGKTVLRLVHSGFAADMWDDEFDTLSSGWASFQANLKHYLDRYAMTSRLGDRFEGVIKVLAPPINFTGTAENWSNAFFMLEIEPGQNRCRPALWCSLYGRPPRRRRLRFKTGSESSWRMSSSKEVRSDISPRLCLCHSPVRWRRYVR